MLELLPSAFSCDDYPRLVLCPRRSTIKKLKTFLPAVPRSGPEAGALRKSNFFIVLDVNSCSYPFHESQKNMF